MAHTTYITVDVDRGVATLTLDQPEILNAMSRGLMAELSSALTGLVARPDEVRCIVLTGRGAAFSAGGNLRVHRDRTPEETPLDLGEVLERWYNPVLVQLLELPFPLVMSINGAAAGAGCPLALCGDFVIAARSAYFQCGFTRIGLVPDLGASWLLPRLIGRSRAHAMMMLDQRIDAEQAEAWGMIHQCVDDHDLAATTRHLAQKLARGPTGALASVRRLVLDGLGSGLDQTLSEEAIAQRRACGTDDFREGIAAFFEKRRPQFTGR